MGSFWKGVSDIFTKAKPVTVMGTTVPQMKRDIFKAYIPEFLYKPPFGYPRKANLPLLRDLATTPYVFSVVKTLCDEASSLDWDIVVKDNVENPEKYEEKIEEIKKFFYNPNGNDESWEQIQRSVMRDILELDSGVIVKVFDYSGKMTQIFARDGMTFLKNPDIYGYLGDRRDFVMPLQRTLGDEEGQLQPIERDENVIRHYFESGAAMRQSAFFQYGWTAGSFPTPFGKREIVYIMQNPRTDSIYGRSPVEILADVIQTLHYGERYHLDFFINSNIPEGIVQVAKAQEDELKALKDKFHEKFTRLDDLDNERRVGHRVPFTSAEDVKFVPFTLNPKEMQIIEQQKWFIKVLWASFGVTPDEMGFTEHSNRAIAGEQAKIFKRKAIRPICNVMTYHINTQILPEFFMEEFKEWEEAQENCPLEFRYNDYDQEVDYKKHEILQMEINMGVRTPEMAAEELGINVEELKKQKEEALVKQQEMFKQQNEYGSERMDKEKEKENKKEREPYYEQEEKAGVPGVPGKMTQGTKEKIQRKKKMLRECPEGEVYDQESGGCISKEEKEEKEREKAETKSEGSMLSSELIDYIDEVGKELEKATGGQEVGE